MPIQLTHVHKNKDGVLVKEMKEIKDETLEEIVSKKLRKLVQEIKTKKAVNPEDRREADTQIDRTEKYKDGKGFLCINNIGGLTYLINYDPGESFFIYKESLGDGIYSARNYRICKEENCEK